ncbi:hypothetical protein BB560_001473 [Smittium megazygosporum]|uniref:Amino acid permease/ SLC12A domain-containing protein n=2 Tax=Smittium megazygosporum TaxID=133381 RepID=A0A2T9ZHF2_9FUNG|nr:hypothetical protein BB560_001473 [Smittium megazygosporum]
MHNSNYEEHEYGVNHMNENMAEEGKPKRFVSQDNLQRSLKSRHMSMIAIGGTIGTGLFVASGASLAEAGPGGSLLAYIITGIIVYFVMSSLAEMSTFIPVAGSFNSFADRFVDPSFGFAIAYNYWYSWIVTTATDLVAAGTIVKFWLPNVNPLVWSAASYVIVIFLNMFGARLYGETEFWLALIKVLAIIIFIVVAILVAAGALGGHTYGVKSWSYKEAPFVGKFGGFISVFIYAGFSFQGTEIVGVTSGESKNPSRDVPKAIRSIFWRILLFYVLTIFLIGLIVPYDDENLLKADIDAVAVSPLVLVLERAGVKPAPHIMNAVILTSVFSASNSGLYLTARALYSLAVEGKGPKMFTRVSKQGTPVFALGFGCIIVAILVGISAIGNTEVYTWLVALSGVAGFIAWIGILFTAWRFRRAYKIQGYDQYDLPYVSILYPFGPIFSFVLLIFIVLAQGYGSFIDAPFDASLFFQTYIGIPIFLIMWLLYKFLKKTKYIKLSEIDLETDNYISLGFENCRHIKTTWKEKLASLI